jgi:hypothetical protein
MYAGYCSQLDLCGYTVFVEDIETHGRLCPLCYNIMFFYEKDIDPPFIEELRHINANRASQQAKR